MTTIRSRSAVIAGCLVAAPLALTAEHLLLDPLSAGSNAGQLRLIAEHHEAYVWGNLLGLLGAALMIPAVYGVAAAVRGRGRIAATWAAACVTIACVATGGVMTSGLLMAAMASSPNRRAMATALDTFTGSVSAAVVLVAFLLGIAAALWALAAAVWRSRIAPRWVVAVMVALPFLDFLVEGGPVAEAAGVLSWLALTVAFGRIGLSLLRAAEVASVGVSSQRYLLPS